MNTENKSEPSPEKLFDLCTINRLCRGDKNFIKGMIAMFIEQIPSAVDEIKRAYEKTDFVTIKKTAHRIKPVLSIYAIIKIEQDIKELEMLAEERMKTTELELKIRKIDTVISQVARQMKRDYL